MMGKGKSAAFSANAAFTKSTLGRTPTRKTPSGGPTVDINEESFGRLILRVKDGEPQAIERLISAYGDSIQRVVRRRLNRRMRQRFDSLDFTQDVWKSFFSNLDDVSRFESPEKLNAYLARVSSNKVVDACRRCFTLQKDNMNRERPLLDEGEMGHAVAYDNQPTPSEVVVAKDQQDKLLENHPPQYEEILQRRIAGQTHKEIAEQLKISKRTVMRVLQRIAKRVATSSAREDGDGI